MSWHVGSEDWTRILSKEQQVFITAKLSLQPPQSLHRSKELRNDYTALPGTTFWRVRPPGPLREFILFLGYRMSALCGKDCPSACQFHCIALPHISRRMEDVFWCEGRGKAFRILTYTVSPAILCIWSWLKPPLPLIRMIPGLWSDVPDQQGMDRLVKDPG